ncbi:MAG: efflux RND transporter permease subunit [Candidatus Omnitrophota bacterium]
MSLPEFGVKKPVTNLMIFSAIIILALYSLSRLGIDMMPEIEPPSITVISSYPGAGSEDVETNVTEELENQLGTTPGLEKITSTSSEGSSMITLKFIWGTNLDEASNDVRDRIELAKRFLPDIPDEMDNPFIFKFNTANIPIIYFGITAEHSYAELYDLVDKKIGDALRQLPGVGTVQINGGGMQRQINIWINRQRLEGYGFSVLDIQNKLKQENITQPVGGLKTGLTDYLVRLPGEFMRPEEINLIILGKRNGTPIYLKDVARIEDSFKEVDSLVRFNKQPGIMMMVQKQSGTNSVEVAKLVKDKMQQLIKILPADVKVKTIFDTSEDIINSLDSLKFSVWLGIIMVIMVAWFFFRSLAPSLVVALTIPFSLLIAFIYLFLSKGTINTITLSSLAIATGMVVDNAIVIVDNVLKRLDRGNRTSEAAIFGASEMFRSVAASTLTTIVVFMPMLFIPGVVGIIFGGLAMIIIVTLTASLFTATTFTPMLCAQWLGFDHRRKKSELFIKLYNFSEYCFKSLEAFYQRALGFSLRHKKLILIGFVGAFIFSMFLIPFVGNEFMPEEDTGDLRITINLPIGTRIEESDKIAKRIEEIFDQEAPEAKYYYSRCGQVSGVGRMVGGSSGTHIISAGAKLIAKDKRKRSVKEVGQAIRNKIKLIPGVLRTDVSTGNPLGRLITGTGGKAIQLEIIGNSFADTNALAAKIKTIMEKIPGAVDVSISREANSPELKIDIDREKAAGLGLDMTTIATTLKTFIQGSTATKYRENGKTYDIYVRLEDDSRTKLEDVENLTIVAPLPEDNTPFVGLENLASRSGVSRPQIKLSNIAKIYEASGPDKIERKNRERMVRVQCNAYQRSSGKIVDDLNLEISKLVLPPGVMINIGGEAEEQKKAFRDLTLLLVLGIALVYMVMAAQFESLLDPFIIMFAIPFTFIGVILGFVLTGTTLSINTFLGIVMLMGIVVNNAIVLISYIIMLRARGYSMYEAVTIGGRDRLRPILMTTITTIAGLLPLALSRGQGSEVWQPLGITMIGGLTVSTLVTLLFVPTLYAVFHRKAVSPEVIKE